MQNKEIYAIFILSIISSTTQQETTRCPPFAQIVNGKMDGTCANSIPGSVCSFMCNEGFVIEGKPNSTCSFNGQWSSSQPICLNYREAHCPAIFAPLNGQAFGRCASNKPGSVCVLSCNPGFEIQGVDNIVNLVCGENNKWSAEPTICQRHNEMHYARYFNCSSLPYLRNGQMSGMCADSRPGSVCTFSCNAGFEMQGNGMLICGVNGVWSSPIPHCRNPGNYQYNYQQNNQHHNQQNNQQNNDYLRNNGHHSNYNNQMCPNIYHPRNGGTTGNCINAGRDAICSFQCNQVRRLNGLSSLLCNADYTWSGIPPTCV